MAKDIFSLLIARFSADAAKELRTQERQRREDRRRHQAAKERFRLLKYCLLLVALGAVVIAVHFRDDLGALVADMTSAPALDPSLRVPQKTMAKHLRGLAEARRQRDTDLDDIGK